MTKTCIEHALDQCRYVYVQPRLTAGYERWIRVSKSEIRNLFRNILSPNELEYTVDEDSLYIS